MHRQEAEARIRAAVLAFPLATREALLHVITAPEELMAEAIESLYGEPDGREAADVLIELEEDRRTAPIVVDVLNASLRDRSPGTSRRS